MIMLIIQYNQPYHNNNVSELGYVRVIIYHNMLWM